MKYQPTIGLEIHAQLQTNSKMFCSCKNDPFVRKPNIYICPVCLGMPGSLPVLNQKAVEMTILAGLALNCQISHISKWDRKNYFYPDLPKGYQISQYDLPLCLKGYFQFSIFNFQFSNKSQISNSKIRIRRVHLEEDTAKLIHPQGANYSLIDFNRAGVPLIELVTEPEITSATQAKEFGQEIQRILRRLGVSQADMEKGQMRVEANVSLRGQSPTDWGLSPMGTKVEIKNLNSFRSVERAINFEIKRQSEILEKGKKVVQETRGWNERRQQTFSQRGKEAAPDYRYFPEPDLPPVSLSEKEISKYQEELPELPTNLRLKLIENYHLSTQQAQIIAEDANLLELLEKTVEQGMDSREVAKAIINRPNLRRLSPQKLKEKILSEQKEKEEVSPDILEKILKQNQKAVLDYQKGKENALEFLLGQVMREMKGQVDAESVKIALVEKLK